MDSKSTLLGYPVSAAGLAGDVERAWSMMRSGGHGNYVACVNPHSLVAANGDREFSKALREASLLLPDGIGVVLARRLLCMKDNGRVAGFEFFNSLSQRAQRQGGIRYFFFGSSDAVLDKIRARMESEYPAIGVAGVLSPPFKDTFSEVENDAFIEAVNRARPDVLWVGMTAPKQEKWIHANRSRLNVPLVGAIGAVFDFYAGTVPRAPVWACRLGVEWLVRFWREPRRLWRRNVVSAPLFTVMVLREHVLGR